MGSLWEVKSYIDKVKNVVFQYTELEGKVREATNLEPWGASSTLMTEIAEGTQSYRGFGEVMGMLFKRMEDPTKQHWRQLYKSLQLLEYLLKNGSERVVDEARVRLGHLRALEHFNYIDEKGKDQGINVRHRAKEIIDLIGDTEKLRNARRVAKENKSKYVGTDSTASRYGGFGNSGTQSSYEGGNGGGGYNDRYSNQRQREQETPNYETRAATQSNKPQVNTGDLFSFDQPDSQDEDWGNMVSAGATGTKHKFLSQAAEDDFADFESAAPPPQATGRSIPQPLFTQPPAPVQSKQPIHNNNGFDFFAAAPPAQQPPLQQQQPPPQQNLFAAFPSSSSTQPMQFTTPAQQAPLQPQPQQDLFASFSPPKPAQPPTPGQAPAKNDIWAAAGNLVSLDSLGSANQQKQAPAPSMNAMQNSNNFAFGSPQGFQPPPSAPRASGNQFAAFGNLAAPNPPHQKSPQQQQQQELSFF